MIRFESDYLEGAHPRILARMMETNLDQTPGYGTDENLRPCARADPAKDRASGRGHSIFSSAARRRTSPFFPRRFARIRVRSARTRDTLPFMKPVRLKRAVTR